MEIASSFHQGRIKYKFSANARTTLDVVHKYAHVLLSKINKLIFHSAGKVILSQHQCFRDEVFQAALFTLLSDSVEIFNCAFYYFASLRQLDRRATGTVAPTRMCPNIWALSFAHIVIKYAPFWL